MKAVLGLAAVLLSASSADALDPNRATGEYGRAVWTEANGLVFGAIHAMAQDHDGYLWLGTDQGLIRFDGTTFVPWPVGTQSPLARAGVYALLAARDNSLWIAGAGGVGRMRHGKVATHAVDVPPMPLLTALAEDRDGGVWVGTPRGVLRFADDTWQQVSAAEGLPDGPVYTIYADPRGRVWVSMPAGVFRQSSGPQRFTRIIDYSVSSLDMDPHGGVWVTDAEHGLHRVEPAPAHPPRFVGQPGTKMLRDRDSNLWIGTEGLGIWRVQTDRAGSSRAEQVRLEPSFDPRVRSLIEDRDGNVWIATRTALLRLSDTNVTMIGTEDGLPEAGVAAVTVTGDQRVWVGTSQGLYSVSGRHTAPLGIRLELDGSVTALHVDTENHLWLARVFRGARRFEIGRFEAGRFRSVPLPPGALFSPVRAFVTDGQDGLWICENVQGLLRWHRGRLEQPDDVGRAPCMSAETDASGRHWFGLRSGRVASYADGVLRAFDVPAGTPGSGIGVSTTVHAGPHAVWLLTPRILFRFHNGGWSEVVRASQPPGPFMPSLIEDASGSVWTGVGSGVLKVSTGGATGAAPALRVIDEFSGFAGTVGGRPDGWPAAARSDDGRIWFATSRGLAVIDPAQLRPRDPARAPRIDRVVADGRELQGESRVDIPPGTTKLDIHYGALDLSAPQSIRYRYLLEGSDTEWVDAGTRREAFYTNLRPRTYTFRVNVSDRDGGWTGNSSTISLIVQPTFTQTTWFYILIGCAGLCAIAGAWWLRLQAVRNRFATILAERARVAREIHDGLLQNLGSVAVELEVVTNELAGAPQPAVETLRQLRRRVTESVREARDSIEHLRSTARPNGNIVTALNELATSVSAEKDVQCTVASVRGTLRPGDAGIEEQLLRIAREAVGNAVRHGHATRIAIELEYQKDAVLLSVTDDGCGFDPHDPACATHGHWGIASMRERAASVGGSFTITSRPGEGTQMEAVVPIHTDSGPR